MDGPDETKTKHVLKLANKLLKYCNFTNKVNSLNDLNSDFFLTIYESICATELVDKKHPIECIEDEIHNIQSIIDSLSLDILHEDLSHITGEAIMNRDLVSIEYLLDIYSSILEWITSRIEMDETGSVGGSSDASTPVNDNNNGQYGNDGTDNLTISSLKSNYVNDKLTFGDGLDTDRNNLHELKNFIDSSILNLNEKIQNELVHTTQTKMKQMNENWLSLLNEDVAQPRQGVQNVEGKNEANGRSVTVVGMLSEIKRKKQELLESFTSTTTTSSGVSSNSSECDSNEVSRHVKFENYSSNSSKTSKLTTNRSTGHEKSSASVNEQNITNELSIIKNGIERATTKDNESIKKLLKHIYAQDYQDAKSISERTLNKVKKTSDRTNDIYLDTHRPKPVATKPVNKCVKSVLIPNEYKRPLRKTTSRTRSASATPRDIACGKSRLFIGEDGVLNVLLNEFPNIYMSPETIHELWSKHSRQLESLSREQKDLEKKYLNMDSKSYVQNYLDTLYKKQSLLMDIMRKDLQLIQRKQDIKRKQDAENALKIRTREQRFQSIKVKRYFEEFRLQQRSKMLKSTTKEEVLFKKLFNESLKIQRERILEMKRYANEKRDISVKQQLNQIESIENFYKNKFQLLNEQLTKEKQETQLREKSQHDVLIKMKSQLKSKLENDIRDLQSQMCSDEDYIHWRQLDANRVKDDLKYARYQAKV